LSSILKDVTYNRSEAVPYNGWWRQAVVYQIYPRSFADSNGDGIGDLRGVVSRIPYLAALGVDAVWLSPFYPSALADGGYDVDDYRDVDPKLGTLDDFDDMVAILHAHGIKLIVDIVPNHTSNRHVWFQEALAAPAESPARERYIFRDGTGPDGAEPPSDWHSSFGGSAWTRVADGQWYLHLFAPEQPDLNWDNPEVRADFIKTIRFWSDRGADGFRVDVAHGLAKDLREPLPAWRTLNEELLVRGAHPFTDRDEVHEIYAEWRQVFDEYDPPRSSVAEAWVHPSRRSRYASATSLGQVFNFDLVELTWNPAHFRQVIVESLADATAAGSSSTWVLSNHDVVRHASRYGLLSEAASHEGRVVSRQWVLSGGTTPQYDPALGLRRARAASLLMLALPGSAYLYQGEELGLPEVPNIPDEHRQDPTFFTNSGVDKGRDGCRVPIPWTSNGPSFGFSTGTAHLPQPQWFAAISVQAQEADAESTLLLYRRALRWRRRLQTTEELRWRDAGSPSVLHFMRNGGWHSITNFGPEPVPLPEGTVIISSAPLSDGALPSDTTVWILATAETSTGSAH
jgi:alpha-glucosidase